MNIGFLVFANKDVGMGHWSRSKVLHDEVGTDTVVVGDKRFLSCDVFIEWDYGHYCQSLNIRPFVKMKHARLDWLVIDTPNEPPDWLYEFCQGNGIKTCALNGRGDIENASSRLAHYTGLNRRQVQWR